MVSNRFRNTLVLEPCPRWARDQIIDHFWKHMYAIRRALHDDVFRIEIDEMDPVNHTVFLTFTTSNAFMDVPSKIVQEICWALRKNFKPSNNQLADIFAQMSLNEPPMEMTVRIAEYNGNMVTYNIVNGLNKGMNVVPINTQKFFDLNENDFPMLVK